MKTKRLIITVILLCCFFAGFATVENLSGKWTGLLKTDQGDEYPLLYHFKVEGDELTGTAKTPKGEKPIMDGKVTGSTFTFNVTVAGMQIDHSGRFYKDSVGVDISLGDARSHATLMRTE